MGYHAISGIPLYIDQPKATGLWTYFLVNEEEEAYTRLCYCVTSKGGRI